MSIKEVDVSLRPVCPQCLSKSHVVPIYTTLGKEELTPQDDLTRWFCDRCNGVLSALTPPAGLAGIRSEGEGI